MDTKQPTRPDPRKGKPQKQRSPTHAPVVITYEDRPVVPDELREKTWAELHSPEGIGEARRSFTGTAHPYRGSE